MLYIKADTIKHRIRKEKKMLYQSDLKCIFWEARVQFLFFFLLLFLKDQGLRLQTN